MPKIQDWPLKMQKKATFYKHFGFKGATSHIDDMYGFDVDDNYNVGDILAEKHKKHFSFKITKNETIFKENPLHIGYLKLDKIALKYKHPILIKKAPRVFGMLFY